MIHTPHEKGLEFHGGGGGQFSKTKTFQEMYQAILTLIRIFLEGWGGGGSLGKNPFSGGGMDVVWNSHTVHCTSK